MKHRLLLVLSLLLILFACGRKSKVLNSENEFFVPFGSERGELGSAVVTNDRLPLVGTCQVEDGHFAMFDNETNRLLVYSTRGRLVIDRHLGKLGSKTWPRPIFALGPSGEVWLACPEDQKIRVYHIRDEDSPVKTAILFENNRETLLGGQSLNLQALFLKELIAIDAKTLVAVWDGHTRRGNSDILSTVALSLADLETRTVKNYPLDYSALRKSESGDARFESIVSAHPYRGGREFLLEARFHKPDLRNPFEKAVFLFNLETGSLERLSLPFNNWSSLIGLANDGSLFFNHSVVIDDQITRALIAVYRLNSSDKEVYYSIESEPTSPILGNLLFAKNGTLHGYDLYQSGASFFEWR